MAYFLDGKASRLGVPEETTSSAINRMAMAIPQHEVSSERELRGIVTSWMQTIDGHRLWRELADEGRLELAGGWILENYHYLRSSPRHVSAAISACPDPIIRAQLVQHLAEEAGHAEILAAALTPLLAGRRPAEHRPLPTTVSFIGYLRDLASADWKAYCVAITYLQVSYDSRDARHSGFYERLSERLPEAAPLAHSMSRHDALDSQLDHGTKLDSLVADLLGRHRLEPDSLSRAAMVAQLAWGFLDGILRHYETTWSLRQRVGWRG
jgi:pyrroloquinoline quinone (PQQ) biosynthesis protein C